MLLSLSLAMTPPVSGSAPTLCASGLSLKSLYEPLNATAFRSENHFFTFPNNVSCFSPLCICVLSEAWVNVTVLSELFPVLFKYVLATVSRSSLISPTVAYTPGSTSSDTFSAFPTVVTNLIHAPETVTPLYAGI